MSGLCATGNRYGGMFKRLLANSTESEQYSHDGSPCWEWTGHREKRGYGRFSMRMPERPYPVMHSAHREMAALALGEPLPTLMTIEHACCIPWCINWLHFKIASRADNSADMRARILGRPRKAFKPLIDLKLFTYDPLIRSLPVLRSSLLEETACPF